MTMNTRRVSISFAMTLVSALSVMGCGGEGAVAPPPAEPDSTAPKPPEATTDKSAESGSTNAPVAKAETTATAAKDAPPVTTDKPATADKPAATDKPATTDKPAEKAGGDIPGANISVGRLEADGLVTKDIECKSDGGGGGLGLLGAVLVTAWMAPQKKALDACVPAGKEIETRVIWKASGTKVTEINAKGDAKVKACVEKALRPGKPIFEGHCAATVVHGKK